MIELHTFSWREYLLSQAASRRQEQKRLWREGLFMMVLAFAAGFVLGVWR